jgi:hypothetical protein
MAARRRTQFPGVSQDATRELIGLQDDLQRDTTALRQETVGSTTDTKTAGYSARLNEAVRVLMPAAGGTIVFPEAGTATVDKWIDVLVLAGSGPVKVAPTGKQVDGSATVTLTTAGRYSFRSDGISSWWRATNGVSGGGLSPVADETVLANVTGAVAVPVAVALSSLAGSGLVWNSALNQFEASGGGGGAPVGAQYIVGTADGTLTSERVATDSSEIDVTIGASTATWALIAASVLNGKLAAMAANTIKGNNTGASSTPLDLTVAQTTAMLDVFTSSLKGLAPASGGGTTNFLRADGTWAVPAGGGGGGENLAATLAIGNSTGANNIQVDAGQHVNFGAAGPATGAPQLRSGDTPFRMRGSGQVIITADGNAAALNCEGNSGNAAVQAFGTNSIVSLSALDPTSLVRISTGGVTRLIIAGNGEWTTPAGSAGQVLTHQGAGVPPLWAAPSGGGGGGSLTLLQAEVNLGSVARYSGTFTIAGAGMTVGARVLVQQSADAPTGKSEDDNEDQISMTARVESATAIRVYWHAVRSPVAGNVKVNYAVSA